MSLLDPVSRGYRYTFFLLSAVSCLGYGMYHLYQGNYRVGAVLIGISVIFFGVFKWLGD